MPTSVRRVRRADGCSRSGPLLPPPRRAASSARPSAASSTLPRGRAFRRCLRCFPSASRVSRPIRATGMRVTVARTLRTATGARCWRLPAWRREGREVGFAYDSDDASFVNDRRAAYVVFAQTARDGADLVVGGTGHHVGRHGVFDCLHTEPRRAGHITVAPMNYRSLLRSSCGLAR